MDLILRARSTTPRAPLSELLRLPIGLDIWTVEGDSSVVLRATEAQADRLRAMGYDLDQLYRSEEYAAARKAEVEADTGVAAYHTVQTMEADLRALADGSPEIAELHEIGRSVEGRPILALRIGARTNTQHKVLFLGCHHAREWLSVEVPFLLAQHLVQHKNDEPVKSWLATGEIWVAPMVNPDGHEYTRTVDRFWRKNRRRNADGSFGVDPNRNYAYMWGAGSNSATSNVPSDITYFGPRAFSEPETRSVRDLVARELFQGVLTYHSYSQLILYPWGFRSAPIDDLEDRTAMRQLAEKMRDLIRGVHDEEYQAIQAFKIYNVPVWGDTTDWTWGSYHIPSITIELRPKSVEEGGFVLPPSQIQPTWEENQPAAFEFIKQSFAWDADD